jgi:hypothetical protein
MNIDDIEQISPKQPNFGLVVGLSCATLLIIFVLALFFVHFDGKHLTFRHHTAHPTSQLVFPPSFKALAPEGNLSS